nr:hypothetical protein [Tanacetum cinerariifolium]
MYGDRSAWFHGVVQYVVLRHGTGFVHNIVSFLGYDPLRWKEGMLVCSSPSVEGR